jgi:2-phosphoglycerate kinase
MRNWLNEFSKNKRSASKISFEDFEGQMNEFKKFVKINESMTLVLAVFCMLRGKKNHVKISDLLEEIEPHMHNDFIIAQVEALFVGGWILYDDDGPFSGSDQIYLTHNAELALKTSNPKAIPRKTIKKEDAAMMTMFARAVSFRNKNISIREWSKYVGSVLIEEQLPFIQYLKSKKLKRNDSTMALYIGLISIFEQSKIEIYHVLNLFCDNPLDYARKRQELTESAHPLYEKEVLEKIKRDHGAIKLGAHGSWISNQNGKHTVTESIDLKNKTLEWSKFEKIKPKKLLYNAGILEQIELLKKVLNPQNFKKFTSQARKNGEYAGVIILLSGGPGTGKTELAKQLALETHRDLLTFQVAQQRNMYLGESEKAIQSVFDDYKRVSKRMDNSPILFFNEADSVFGKRTNNQSIVSQTENTIQTILLNELETFEGILICTTNVPDNFDEAFNRRFLMHIVIDNPDEEIRKELVVQIFPNISESEAKRLASQYTFTAAELGKFKKQWDLQKITGLQKGNLESNLTSFLSQQKNTSKTNPIGYTI